MTCLRKKRTEIHCANPYATIDDFQKLFAESLGGLYHLSFFLTGDHEKAEQCFVAGLEDSVNANEEFKEWARSWAKRTIVRNAIRMFQPRPGNASAPTPDTAFTAKSIVRVEDLQFKVESVLALEAFDRFVFVMSVLESYPDHDCAFLLRCSIQDVRNGRARALRQIVSLQIPAPGSQGQIEPLKGISGYRHGARSLIRSRERTFPADRLPLIRRNHQ